MRCGVELINFVIIAMFCIAVLIFLINVKKENHDLMIKIVATAQDVNKNNAEIIKHNKNLIEALKQKSE